MPFLSSCLSDETRLGSYYGTTTKLRIQQSKQYTREDDGGVPLTIFCGNDEGERWIVSRLTVNNDEGERWIVSRLTVNVNGKNTPRPRPILSDCEFIVTSVQTFKNANLVDTSHKIAPLRCLLFVVRCSLFVVRQSIKHDLLRCLVLW